MIDILEIPDVRRRVSPVLVKDYHQMAERNQNGRRTELIRGVVFEKMSKSPLHSRLAMRLFQMLAVILPEDCFIMKEEPLTFSDSEPEPDISVVRGDDDDFAHRHPSTAALVVEVAVSSPALDREIAALYAEAGVEEYWIVLGREQRVEVYSQPLDGRYARLEVLSRDQTLACGSLPGVSVDLTHLFAAPKAGI